MSASIVPVANTIANSGEVISNVYQDNSNLKVSSARVVSTEAYRFSFQSLSLPNSANTLTIPRNLMVTHCLVEFEMTLTADQLTDSYYLPEAWGALLIERLTLIYGGSEQLEIDGRDSWMRAMCECESDSKKNALLRLAGNAVYKEGTEIVGADADGKIRATVPLYLPHSSCNSERQIGFDCSVLNQNVTVRMDLTSPERLWSNTFQTGDTALAGISDNMRALTKATWIIGQSTMVDSSASKRDLVGPSGSFSLNYFFYAPIHRAYNFQLPSILNPSPGAFGYTLSENEVNVTLNGFRNGSLMSIVFYVERLDGFRNRRGADILGMRNPMNYINMTDVKLLFGGQTVYSASSDRVSKLLDSMINLTDSSYNYVPLGRASDQVVTAATPLRSSYVRIQLSQFSEVFRDYLQTGNNPSSDTMALSFKLIDSFDQQTATDTNITYRLHQMNIYQAAVNVARGVGTFQFTNPIPSPMVQQLKQVQ